VHDGKAEHGRLLYDVLPYIVIVTRRTARQLFFNADDAGTSCETRPDINLLLYRHRVRFVPFGAQSENVFAAAADDNVQVA
jgi:hypothetical protein